MRRIDELHLERPFAGARMLRDFLGREGIAVGRPHVATELRGKVSDGVNQAADFILAASSIPSLNFTPSMTFDNWFWPRNRRQVFDASITSLNTMRRALSCESAPFMRTVRCLTVANTL